MIMNKDKRQSRMPSLNVHGLCSFILYRLRYAALASFKKVFLQILHIFPPTHIYLIDSNTPWKNS
ncbi:hypothetical protein POKO110462_00940 [Pontibacter korlensis]